MRFSFGGADSNGGSGGTSQTVIFVDENDPVSINLDGEQTVITAVANSVGNGEIGYIRFSIYMTIPDLADLSMQLVHPAFRPNITAPGMAGYHVVSYIFESHSPGVADLGQSVDQPVRFVWDVALPSIVDYMQDQYGDIRPSDDLSVVRGLSMAGTWELWVYDYNGPRDGVVVHYAALEIFDETVNPPTPPPSPTPAFTVDSEGLVLSMDASATSGGVDPLRYFWEVYDNDDILIGTGGNPSLSPLDTFTVPAEGNYQVSLRVSSDTNFAEKYLLQSVTVGEPDPPPPPETTNSVYSLNRRLYNTEDDSLLGPGINLHSMGFSFSQAYFNKLASEGVKWTRLCFYPKGIETSPGVYSSTALNHIKVSAARAAAAGIKVLLCPLINSPVWGTNGSEAVSRFPSHWLNNGGVNPTGPATPFGEFSTASLFDVFCSHAEGYLRHIMQEFLLDTNVFGTDLCNEPDVNNAAKVQRGTERMLTWLRDEDNGAGKLWFVATNRYSSQSATSADNDWDAITNWTNVVLQMHTYYAPQSNNDDGWDNSSGMREQDLDKYWNATDNVGSPNATSYSTANKPSFLLHFDSWNDVSILKGVPWVGGEVGVRHDQVGTDAAMRLVWAQDVRDGFQEAGAATIAAWIGSETYAQDEWGSHDSGAMRPEYQALMQFAATP